MFSKLSSLLFAVLALLVLSPAGPMPATAAPGGVQGAPAATYYTVRQDFRRCVSPLCGGWFVAEANAATTRCADGSRAAECYVAEIDFDRIGVEPIQGSGLLQGRIRAKQYSGFGNLGIFIPSAAWQGTGAAFDGNVGTAAALSDNGTRCITFPCFNIDQRNLNTDDTSVVSGVDLSGSGATVEQQSDAFAQLSSGELLALGEAVLVPNQGPAGDGVDFVASSIYIPARQTDDTTFCVTDSDCTVTVYSQEVDNRNDCYCPLCPTTVVNVDTAQRRADDYNRFCANWSPFGSTGGGSNIAPGPCPIPLCIQPPATGCVSNTCRFIGDSTGF